MDDTQIEMLPMLGEFSSIASQYEHIMFYYESGIQQIVAKLQILNNECKNNHENQREPSEFNIGNKGSCEPGSIK